MLIANVRWNTCFSGKLAILTEESQRHWLVRADAPGVIGGALRSGGYLFDLRHPVAIYALQVQELGFVAWPHFIKRGAVIARGNQLPPSFIDNARRSDPLWSQADQHLSEQP